ncbi:hypothetical protein PISMIDRAFT_107950 [Pisolithus microcarpus 441]|uniref:Integrase catalytic domain-containing protein n=1 Tax=Pisolithus microcarpus 441 TaxID=765257 RepID=A0A0C9YRK6_9AGAM|nr:hypothetical protein PISMIDRAFT_107950 [Pisolithus microcarpus 441]
MEHLNQEIQQYLCLFINDQQHTWPSWLKVAQFSYNSKRQDSIGHSPFSITHTYVPCLGVEPAVSKAEAATTCTSNIQSVIESMRKALQHTVEQMVQNAESSWSEAPEYLILSLKPNTVELCLLKTLCIHPVVNVSQVKLYKVLKY